MPLPRFEKLSPERRDAILDAALAEFAEHGFERASLNRILARTRTSKGAAYYYFSDKEDLYLTTLEHALAGLATEVPVLEPVEDARSFWRAAERIYEVVARLFAERPAVLAIVRRDMERVNALATNERLAPLVERVRAWIDGLLEAGKRVGALRADLPEPLLVELVFAVGQTADKYMIASGEIESEVGRRRAVARSIDLLKRLLTP